MADWIDSYFHLADRDPQLAEWWLNRITNPDPRRVAVLAWEEARRNNHPDPVSVLRSALDEATKRDSGHG